MNRPLPIKGGKIIQHFDKEILAAIEPLEEICNELYAYAMLSSNGVKSAKALKKHAEELQKSCALIKKGTVGKPEKHPKIIHELWQNIDATIPLILATMGRTEAEATTREVDGIKNTMLPNFNELAAAHNAIAEHMQSKGHEEFKPKYSKGKYVLHGKDVIGWTAALSLTTLSLFAAAMFPEQLTKGFERGDLEGSANINLTGIADNDAKVFHISNNIKNWGSTSNLEKKNMYRIANNPSGITKIEITPIKEEGKVEITEKDGAKKLVVDGKVFDIANQKDLPNMVVQGRNLGTPITISLSPEADSQYFNIITTDANGKEIDLQSLNGTRCVLTNSNGNAQKSEINLELKEVQHWLVDYRVAWLILGAISGFISGGYYYDKHHKIKKFEVERPEKQLSHVDKLLAAMQENHTTTLSL